MNVNTARLQLSGTNSAGVHVQATARRSDFDDGDLVLKHGAVGVGGDRSLDCVLGRLLHNMRARVRVCVCVCACVRAILVYVCVAGYSSACVLVVLGAL